MSWIKLKELSSWPATSGVIDRTAIMVGAGVLGYFAAASLSLETRMMVALNAALLSWEACILWIMWKCDAKVTKLRARLVDPSSLVPLAVSLVSAALALSLIGYLSTDPARLSLDEKRLHMALAILAVIGIWSLVHLTFAIQYVRYYYFVSNDGRQESTHPEHAGGLQFPGEAEPNYMDFFYFAITVAMCCSTSDVSVDGGTIRRLTAIHAIVSFFFISVIIGLVMNYVTNFF